MKKLAIISIILSLFFLFQPKLVYGSNTNNKFGIHILEPSDLEKAAELVNSSGGDWGYVTIVIQDNDMNFGKWQGFMDGCREKHLIPLVRIATHLEEEYWVKPKLEDVQKWVDFLGSLNWPIKKQYVVIFNEPNHAKEWGSEVNPKEYARILSSFIEKLKIKNENFQILNAGFDLAASNTKTTMDVLKFWQEMNWEVPGIFNLLDGWSSHSYPNHGYIGKPWDKGRTSIRGYEWELWVLKNYFGIKKELPVFITETGWPSQNPIYQRRKIKGKTQIIKTSKYFDKQTVASYLKYAFENVWLKDDKVVAVTPFLLNYAEPFFDTFSWLDKNKNPYPQFETVKSITKNSWWPEQINKFSVEKIELPPFLLTYGSYEGQVNVTNEGQSILGEEKEFLLETSGFDEGIEVSKLYLSDKKLIKPFEKGILRFKIKTSSSSGEFKFGWRGVGEYKIKVLRPSVISKIQLTFWQKILSKIKFW